MYAAWSERFENWQTSPMVNDYITGSCLKFPKSSVGPEKSHNTSARPEVRGTADVGWRSLNPLPINPPRTHSRLIITCVFGPTGGDGHE